SDEVEANGDRRSGGFHPEILRFGTLEDSSIGRARRNECATTRDTAWHVEGSFREEHESACRPRMGEGTRKAGSRPEEVARGRGNGKNRRRARRRRSRQEDRSVSLLRL